MFYKAIQNSPRPQEKFRKQLQYKNDFTPSKSTGWIKQSIRPTRKRMFTTLKKHQNTELNT